MNNSVGATAALVAASSSLGVAYPPSRYAVNPTVAMAMAAGHYHHHHHHQAGQVIYQQKIQKT